MASHVYCKLDISSFPFSAALVDCVTFFFPQIVSEGDVSELGVHVRVFEPKLGSFILLHNINP